MRRLSNDQMANGVLGLNLLVWGGFGLFAEHQLTVVRFCIVAIQLLVGGLILFRKRPVRNQIVKSAG